MRILHSYAKVKVKEEGIKVIDQAGLSKQEGSLGMNVSKLLCDE